MYKYGLLFLFGALTQYFIALYWTQYLMLKKLEITNSVSGSIVENIPLEFWIIYNVELIIAGILILISLFKSKLSTTIIDRIKKG